MASLPPAPGPSHDDDYDSEEDKRSKRPKLTKHSEKKVLQSYLTSSEFKDWLSLRKDGKTAQCTACNTNLKGGKSELKKHSQTKLHMKNMQAKTAQPVLTTFLPQMDKLRQLEASMCTFVVENNLPLSFVEPLSNFCKTLPDKEVVNKLQLGKQKMTNVLREGLRPFFNRDLSEKLKSTPFSLFIDETTDVTTKSQLAVVVSYFDCNDYETKVDLVDVVEMTDGSAQGIYNTMMKVLTENCVPLNNWVGFCSDTTAVMMGVNQSVATLVKASHPQVVIVKCSCHLIHLAASYACKMLPNSLEDLVRTIYNHLKRSPKRTAEFKKFQEFFEPNNSPKKMLAPGQTRWLSLQNCVKRILECWEPLKQYWTVVVFEDKTHANEQVLSTLNNPLLKVMMEFVDYGLGELNEFNTFFQSDAPLFAELKPQVERLLKTLCLNFMRPEYVRSTDASKLNPHSEEHYCPLDMVYLGVSATDTLFHISNVDPKEVERLRTSVRYFYIEAVAQVQKRFTFEDEVNSTFKDAEFLIPANAQNLQPMTLLPIAKKFPGVQIDLPKLDSQWRGQSIEKTEESYTSKYWKTVATATDGLGRLKFPELAKLASIFFSLPFSNAVTERLFSCFKNIKTEKRNRLDNETLSALLCVKYGAKRTKKGSQYFMTNPIPYKTQIQASATATQAKQKRLAMTSVSVSASQQT